MCCGLLKQALSPHDNLNLFRGYEDVQVLPMLFMTVQPFRHVRKAKGTGAEMSPAIVSGIVTGDAPVSYWPIFFPVLSNIPRSLCDPVFLSFLKCRMFRQ